MTTASAKRLSALRGGFTLVEIIIVIMIIGIAAFLAVPMFSSAADIQISTAANIIASDLEYVKSLAITRQKNYSVIFDPANESYRVVETSIPGTPIPHPIKPGATFVVTFTGDSRTNHVNIVDANFDADADKTITFDYLGTPYRDNSGVLPLTANGQISLSADTFVMTVVVEPVTGYITIQ